MIRVNFIVGTGYILIGFGLTDGFNLNLIPFEKTFKMLDLKEIFPNFTHLRLVISP